MLAAVYEKVLRFPWLITRIINSWHLQIRLIGMIVIILSKTDRVALKTVISIIPLTP
jgi:hypothetical protein